MDPSKINQIFRAQYKDRITYVNGQWVKDNEAVISIYDRGYTLGYSVYESLRTFKKRCWQTKEHVERGWQSLKMARINPGISKKELEQLCIECADQNQHLLGENEDYCIMFDITPGVFDRTVLPDAHGRALWELPENQEIKSTIIVKPIPLAPMFVKIARFYSTGCHVVHASIRHLPPQCLDPKIKTYNRLSSVLATHEVKLIDVEAMPLLLDINGNLSEGDIWNLWLVRDGRLLTPGPKNILRGVSRANIIKLAEKLKIPVVEGDLQPWDLYNADEAFASSTPWSILPIGRYMNVPIGDKVPGPITKRLCQEWSKWVGIDIIKQMEYVAKKYSSI